MQFNSFAELARVFGSQVKAKEKMEHGAYLTVESQCGKKAVVLWAILTDRESCKTYGENGKLLLTPAELAEITGYTESAVIGCLLNLIRNGYARPSSCGSKVKAA
jgi:hypothetical protein